MDNLIKKFNEELKYYFPESRLEAVLFEIPLSESKSIDIRGDLNVMEFYKFLNFNKIWITENLQKYFHVENWKDYNVHPQKAGLGTFIKIAFTNEKTQKSGCMNMQYFDPILYREVVFTETTADELAVVSDSGNELVLKPSKQLSKALDQLYGYGYLVDYCNKGRYFILTFASDSYEVKTLKGTFTSDIGLVLTVE